jgi:endonuclease YncB( thermonuclease family)
MQGLLRCGLALAWWGTVIATAALADVMIFDGDTMQVNRAVYDIHGIDAPEYRQKCADGLPAGVMAYEVLRELVRQRMVTCEPKSGDRYSRATAVCRVEGLDLGAMMVRGGWAWASARAGGDYLRPEREAWAARRGVHGHDCMAPWDWREMHREAGP